MTKIPVARALISVSDKTGLAELGAALAARGVELVSTGGTCEAASKFVASGASPPARAAISSVSV